MIKNAISKNGSSIKKINILAYIVSSILGLFIFQIYNTFWDKSVDTLRISLSFIVAINITVIILLIFSIAKSELKYKIASSLFLLLSLFTLAQYLFVLLFSGYPY